MYKSDIGCEFCNLKGIRANKSSVMIDASTISYHCNQDKMALYHPLLINASHIKVGGMLKFGNASCLKLGILY